MKTRQGFVSNSSASSFIVMGVPFTKSIEDRLKKSIPTIKNEQGEDEEDYEWRDRLAEKLNIGILYWEGETSYIIGEIIADTNEHLDFQKFSIEDLLEIKNRVQNKIGEIPSLIIGTHPS